MSSTTEKTWSLWSFMRGGKRRPVMALALMALGTTAFALMPLFLSQFIEDVSARTEQMTITSDIALGIFLTVIGTVLFWFVTCSVGRAVYIREISSKIMRDTLVEKIDRMSVASLEDSSSGDIAALMSNDIPVVYRMMCDHIPRFVVNVTLLVVIQAAMFYLDYRLALLYLGLTLFTYVFIRYVSWWARRDRARRQEAMADFSGYLGAAMASHSLVKLYGMEGSLRQNFDTINRNYRGSLMRTVSRTSVVDPISRIVDNIGFAVTAFVGIVMWFDDTITFSVLLVFVSYAAIIGTPMLALSSSVNGINDAMSSYDRMLTFLGREEMPPESDYEPLDVTDVKGDIEFDGVSFIYPDGTAALRDIDLTIEHGSTTAIVGAEGSGRSTLIDLIMGFRTATAGKVLIDGKEISGIRRRDLRAAIGSSPQDPQIMEWTVYDNLSVTRGKAEIEEMSRRTGFDSAVRGMRRGYGTVIGGRGHDLSSGEMQKLSVTRLMLYDPKVMIFDESISNVDPVTGAEMFDSVRDEFSDRTVIIVDNSVHPVMAADKVVFMRAGTVDDTGTHEELMARNPGYRDLFRSMTV